MSQAVHDRYTNGDEYIGEVRLDARGKIVKDGIGTYRFARGSMYEGEWKDGAMHGWGSFNESDSGDVYEGYWSCGKRSFGVYRFASGDTYEGAFDANHKHGRGIVWESRRMYEVVYERDVLLSKVPFCTDRAPLSAKALRQEEKRANSARRRQLPSSEEICAAAHVLKRRRTPAQQESKGLVFEREDVLKARFRFH